MADACEYGNDLILEGQCIIFSIYIHSNEIHNVAAMIVY